MHAISTAVISPRASPHPNWAPIEDQQPAQGVSRRDTQRVHDHGRHGEPRARGTQFAQQAIHTEVMSRLRASFQFTATPSLAGLAPDQQAAQHFAAAAGQVLAPGGNGAQALRDSVELGLQDAAQQLQGLGVPPEDIFAAADALRGQLQGLISASGAQAEIAVSGRLDQKQKTKLEIVTQEGDIVKLSLRTRLTTTLSCAAVNGANGTASAVQGTTIVGSKLELSVEGNLNSEEVAAIRDVLVAVEQLAADFFSGDVAAAFAAASDLGIDGEQLASVAIKMSARQRITTTGFLSQPVAGNVPPAPQPALADPSTVAPVDASPAAPATPLPAATPEAPAAAPTGPAATLPPDAAAPAVTAVPVAAESPIGSIGRYLTQVLRGLSEDASSMNLRLKFDLLLSATQLRAAPAATATNAAIAKLEEATNALA